MTVSRSITNRVGPSLGIGLATRAMHWLAAALVAVAFGLAWSFDALGPGSIAGRLVGIHRNVGLAIGALTAIRLAWRTVNPLPPLPPLPLSPAWEVWLARGVQAALYLALLVQPLLGWAASSAQGDTVTVLGGLVLPDLVEIDPDRADRLSDLHMVLGYAILFCLALHVAGALRHGLIRRDGVLRRMVTGQAVEEPQPHGLSLSGRRR